MLHSCQLKARLLCTSKLGDTHEERPERTRPAYHFTLFSQEYIAQNLSTRIGAVLRTAGRSAVSARRRAKTCYEHPFAYAFTKHAKSFAVSPPTPSQFARLSLFAYRLRKHAKSLAVRIGVPVLPSQFA